MNSYYREKCIRGAIRESGRAVLSPLLISAFIKIQNKSVYFMSYKKVFRFLFVGFLVQDVDTLHFLYDLVDCIAIIALFPIRALIHRKSNEWIKIY